MSVQVKLFHHFTRFTDGQMTVEVEGRSVGECLKHLVGQFPALKNQLFAGDALCAYVEVFINHQSAYPEELSRVLKEGDEIYIAYAISGG